MRYGKWFIALFTAVLILAAVIFGTNEYAWDGTIGITAELFSEDGAEQLQCWEIRWSNEDKRGYFFLPSYARLSQLRLQTNAANRILLNGREIVDGMTCEGLQTDTAYDLCYLHKGREYHFSLIFLRSANLPAMYIDTVSGSLEYIHEQKGNAEPGELRLYDEEGRLQFEGALETIKGRGNSTWEYEKKPYNLLLKEDADLLGMGAAKQWILLANAGDSSQMRNKLAYDLARELGMAYAPECQWVDLYVNGEYEGLYLLSERNEVHEQRIDIAGAGGFLVLKDWAWRFREESTPYFVTEADMALQIRYTEVPEAQLREAMQSVENAILAADGVDPVTGKHWQELIDLDSWVKKYLLEETLGNVDASTLSQYYYREESGGKIFAGPIWDMDLTLQESSVPWMNEYDLFYGNTPGYGSYWLPALYQDPVFYTRLTQVYAQELLPLLQQLREEGIAAYAQKIGPAVEMNHTRWEGRDLEREVPRLFAYLDKRMDFLNRIWIEGEDCVVVEVREDNGKDANIVLRAGETLHNLPVYENTQEKVYSGWYYQDTQRLVDPDEPIREDMAIELRYTEAAPAEQVQTIFVPAYVYGPAAVFLLLLSVICLAGWYQTRTTGKRTRNPIGE